MEIFQVFCYYVLEVVCCRCVVCGKELILLNRELRWSLAQLTLFHLHTFWNIWSKWIFITMSTQLNVFSIISSRFLLQLCCIQERVTFNTTTNSHDTANILCSMNIQTHLCIRPPLNSNSLPIATTFLVSQ